MHKETGEFIDEEAYARISREKQNDYVLTPNRRERRKQLALLKKRQKAAARKNREARNGS